MPSITFSVDALPAFWMVSNTERCPLTRTIFVCGGKPSRTQANIDRKSTRLNSSHTVISYAVFCLKKKSKSQDDQNPRPRRIFQETLLELSERIRTLRLK